MRTTLSPARPAQRGLPSEPGPTAAVQMDADPELTDDELEAVVGGLARTCFPGIPTSAAQAPA